MGRKTFESIGKPLDNRINCVISRKKFIYTILFAKFSQKLSYMICKLAAQKKSCIK